MRELHWTQTVTDVQPNRVMLRGYPIDELMGKCTFPEIVYLALKGELPAAPITELIDAILVSSIDHGATPPSTLAARTAASTGAPLNAALASGILSINKYHGGAIEDAMRTFLHIQAFANDEGLSLEESVEQVLSNFRVENKRVMGFGHRIHSDDPRQRRLFSLAEESGVAGDFVTIAELVAAELKRQIGKPLPINVDGAIAAILCDLEFPPELANAFFIIARVPGLVAHIHEEQSAHNPMRKIHPTDHEYSGPEERHINE